NGTGMVRRRVGGAAACEPSHRRVLGRAHTSGYERSLQSLRCSVRSRPGHHGLPDQSSSHPTGSAGTAVYTHPGLPERARARFEPMATQTPPTTPRDGGGGSRPPRPRMSVYGGGAPPRRPRRRGRRWLRIALWTFGTIFVVLLVVAAALFYMFYGDYNKLTSPPPSFVPAETNIDPLLPEANAPAIALVIGSDHRYTDGSAPARSDTLMLVRIDPRTHLISLLSLPRDLWVDIPGFGQDKINAAFSDGGPKTVLQTVKQLTGLRVNYLVGVNFHSFT